MRLGIDFDNTFADFGGMLRRLVLERTGFDIRAVREADPTIVDMEAVVHAAIGKGRLDALIQEILETDLSDAMEPRPGAIEVARRLGERHDLVVVAARNERESGGPRRWLARHGIPLADYIPTAYGPKAPIAQQQGLHAHLDDSVTVFAEFDAAHPTLPVLLVHPMNVGADRPAHWRTVEDWAAFERLVGALERERY
ncbi:MAG: hypothetical protein WC273_09775 [Dehalococcoidia bacterium]